MKGKYSRKHTKPLALILSLVLVIGCVAGGTLAWLNAKTDEVKNTFSTSDIGVTLKETPTPTRWFLAGLLLRTLKPL